MITQLLVRHTPSSILTPRPPAPRGIAMLLVLVCLATMAVMTAAYLSAHGNAGVIAENATEAVETELAAKSAGDLAEAVLQADLDLTPAQIQTMFQDHNLAGVTITAEATTFEGTAPSGEAEPLLITVKAQGAQRQHTMQKTANFEPEPDAIVNLDDMDWTAGEFAVFGTRSVSLETSSRVTRWASSPLAASGKTLKVGTNSESSGAIQLLTEASIAGGHAFFRPTASATALFNDGGFDTVSRQSLPSGLPLVTMPVDYTGVQYIGVNPGSYVYGATFALGGTRKYDWLMFSGGTTVTLQDGCHLAVSSDLYLDGSTIRVDGDVQITAFRNLFLINKSSIELTAGSTLKIFVADEFKVDNSSIGFDKEVMALKPEPSADLPYADPNDIFIAGGHTDANNMTISHSFIRGRIYAQLDSITIQSNSAIYGSVLGRHVKVSDHSHIHYDHSLDCETGYTVTEGPLYDEADGELIDAVWTAVADGDYAEAEAVILEANGVTTEVTVAEATPEITVRKQDRCTAMPRPTKACKYEGRPLAHAEADAR